MKALVGTSGWQYKDWRGAFYPERLARARWLEYYADRFSTVEVNNAFYRLPERSTFESWRERTPSGFEVALKASRYLTHIKRLQDPDEPVRRMMDRARGLGDRLGPVLLQLPPTLRCDLDALAATLRCFPEDVRVAVEFRHQSWFVEATQTLLSDFDAAFCLVDRPQWRAPNWRTASWGYVRFHAGRAEPAPCYGSQALRTWAHRLKEMFNGSARVFVYFNNDAHACAPRNAAQFAAMV